MFCLLSNWNSSWTKHLYILCQGGYVFAHVNLLVGWFICQQDCTRNTQWISTKLGWVMDLGPKHDPFTFGVDPDTGTDPGNVYSLSLVLRDEVFPMSLLIS